MSKINHIQGLDVLKYLRKSGVKVNDELCSVVPDEVVQKKQKSKAHCVIDILSDDKEGTLSSHFPDYYNRFPEATAQSQITQLQKGFRKFVQQILFSEKHTKKSLSPAVHNNSAPDILSDNIDILVSQIRREWLGWSINKGYEEIIAGLKELLPLLQKKYQNPMLDSDAAMMDEDIADVIPDEYITFLYDMLVMISTIYNIKIELIREEPSLWAENADFMNDIRDITSYIYYTLAWTVFNTTLTDHKNSISYLSRELLSCLNTFYYAFQQAQIRKKRISENPPEPEKE